MLAQPVQEALNKQVQTEAKSLQAYLAMASWSEIQPGLAGVTDFFISRPTKNMAHAETDPFYK